MSYIERINIDHFSLWRKMEERGLLSQVSMELTERCNNNCIHCYINLPADDEEAKDKEIIFEEIKTTADEAVRMGCFSWLLTGGEPLLREDFSHIYLYLKRKGMRVTVFTNATLISSNIACLFKKYPTQNLEVSIYGLSQNTYEAVTRNPGSFDAFKRGINLLKENHIPFTVKAAALPQNFDEIRKMRDFAQSLTGEHLGVVLKLNLRSKFDEGSKRDRIKKLRLPSEKVMEVLKQDERRYRKDIERFCRKFLGAPGDDRLFICGAGVGGCHIDASKFQLFRYDDGKDNEVTIHHHCGLPKIRNWGEKIYHRAPWMIYETPSTYIYRMFVDGNNEPPLVAIFNKDHTKGHIYKGKNYVKALKKGNLTSLLCFPTDQVLFARLLADRRGIILHGSGLIFKEKGYLFVGHSDAGKTTLAKLFRHHARILNDDRMIVKKEDGRFYLYGTPWHGDLSLVAPDRVPLKALFFLNQAKENKVEKTEGFDAFKRLYGCTIKTLVTERWTKNALDICQDLSREVPCYHLYFDKTEGVISTIEKGVRS